jgi:hypothetical protein
MEIRGSPPGNICADSGRGKKDASFSAVATDSSAGKASTERGKSRSTREEDPHTLLISRRLGSCQIRDLPATTSGDFSYARTSVNVVYNKELL